jgi:Kinesin motor domain
LTNRSSRSHCIYRIKLCNQSGNDGLLTIVDLAGSERCEPKLTDKTMPNDVFYFSAKFIKGGSFEKNPD